MPAYQILWQEEQENQSQLKAQLDRELAECTEVKSVYRNKVKAFMVEQGIWHISELDYPLRETYQRFLAGQIFSRYFNSYVNAFDQIKQHSIWNQPRKIKGKRLKLKYENQLLFLLYHPDQTIVNRLTKVRKKTELLWDFGVDAPETMKRQVFLVLDYLIETDQTDKYLREQMNALWIFYQYCIGQKIEDIESLELCHIQKFRDALGTDKKKKYFRIVDMARKALFLQAEEIHWGANVWYFDRFCFQPERVDPSNRARCLSFLEVTNKRNRELLKQYARYGLGITNLAINHLRSELYYIRNSLTELEQKDVGDVCLVTEKQMDVYFQKLQEKEIQAESYNKIVKCIQRFFNYLQVHQHIEKSPFCAGYYLKKVMPQHHDRSVELETSREIPQKLYLFPEEIRLMYLHLWGIGLRLSEVCTLKGDAYYAQGRDFWIQIYQIKMKNYKRVPIPEALYQLMKVYMKKQGIGIDDYIFQNQRGGAYCKVTFRRKMIDCCAKNHIKNGEYIFQSHDYRHSIATLFYDKKVSLQAIRDYLGHTYEEMTQQYIDYMPRKLADANDEYFSRHSSLAVNLIKKKKGKNGQQNLFGGSAELPDSNCGTEKECGEKLLL